eukprot:gene9452-17175_t
MNTFWKVVQTTVTFGVVGYAAYLWYDNWREEQREAQLQEEEEAEAAAAQAAEKEKAQASSSQITDGNQSKKSSENTTKVKSFVLIHEEVQPVYLLGRRTSTSFVMTEACMAQSFQDFLSFVYPANMPRGTKYAPSTHLVSIRCLIVAQSAAGPIAFYGPPLKSLIQLLFNTAM